jgi:hypothetical protein
MADPLTEAESAFLGKVLSFVPVMARTSKLMRPFLDEGDGSLHELAARSLHQVLMSLGGREVHDMCMVWLYLCYVTMSIYTAL